MRRGVGVLVAVVGSAACAEWPVSNPYDPQMTLEAHVVGPDTIRRLGDTVRFQVVTTPEWRADWPPLVPLWSTGDGPWWGEGNVKPLGDGRYVFVAAAPDAEHVPFYVRARVGDREAFKPVWVRRRAASLRAIPCNSESVSPGVGIIVRFRVDFTVCGAVLDSAGVPIRASYIDGVDGATSRDPAVASVLGPEGGRRAHRLRAHASGTTWVDVSTRIPDGRLLRDSILVTVRL